MESPINPYSTPAANLYSAPLANAGEAVAASTIAVLSATKPWVRFMSVLMWIGVVFMLLAAAGMGIVSTMGAVKAMPASPLGGAQFIILAGLYGVLSFVYIYPALKTWKYANRIGTLVASRSVADLDAALNEQRSFWKFVGIMTIIMISLYLVVIIGFVALGATAAMKSGAFSH